MVKVYFIGNLVADPEVRTIEGRYTGSVTQFRVATSTAQKDADGNYMTNYYSVSYWGTPGENLAKKAHKGDRVMVTGSLAASAVIGERTNKPYLNLSVRADTVERIVNTGASANRELDDEL